MSRLSAMFGLCKGECFTNISAKVKKSLLPIAGWHIFLVSLQSSAPAHSEAILSHTHPRLCHLRLCFHLVWLFSPTIIFSAYVHLHHTVLLHAHAESKDRNTAFGLRSCVQTTALQRPSAIILERKGSFVLFQTHI